MYDYEKLSYLNSASGLKAALKTHNEDFIVDEVMPVVPDQTGEHNWIQVKKNGANTDYVAKQLAQFAGVRAGAVSFAGLKDRNAVTTQWFSVHLPGKENPNWQQCQSDEFEILQSERHSRKLKRGALSANRFQIRLRQCDGAEADWNSRLQLIAENGVPNYFGPQRFGQQMNNLSRVVELIEKNKIQRLKPHKRGIYFSAMRSWIFNRIVSARIAANQFYQPQSGDVFMLAEGRACFSEVITDDIRQRLDDKALYLTAALWGRGETMAGEQVAELERLIAEETPLFKQSLEKAGMKQERRAMRLMPVNMQWQFSTGNCLDVSFELTKGSYATAVLRELGDIVDASGPNLIRG